ncbi:MAG TPA: DsrE family protein [Anaerolineales bacterium]
MAKIMINCTHGTDDPERAILAFVTGNVAASAGQEAVILLTIEGVRNATPGYAESVAKEGFPSMKDTLESFVKNGGQIWVCGTCAKPRGITDKDLIAGARMVTAANAVEYLVSGAASLDW